MGIAGSPLRDRVIFVEGAPRSGTTWLATLLATHPEIAGVEAESHLFDFGVDRLFDNFEGRHPHLHGLQSYLDRDELVDLARDLCDGVLMGMREHVSVGTTPPFVVEKTPIGGKAEGLDLARKAECYPDASYVHIVRERDAVARSLMRAPWMADRSYEACAALWDRTVGHARAALRHLPRYREISYEELRADPAAGLRELFEWLAVGVGEDVMETMRALAREQVSDLGAVPPAGPATRRAALAAAPRRLASVARGAIRRRRTNDGGAEPGSGLAFEFARALRERDATALRAFTAPAFEFVQHSSDGDRTLRGDEGREALVTIAESVFDRRHVGEWWASAGGGPGEWWTSAPGKPFWSLFFSALGGDATRVDLAIGLMLEDDQVRRAVIISAGPPVGRAVTGASERP